MTIINALINYIGVPAIIVAIVYGASILKNKANQQATDAPTKKERALWKDSANALEMLETIGKNYVAGLDKVDAPNSEKRKQAQVQLQAYADEHHIPVDTAYIQGLVESKVNDLRAKQGMANSNNNDNGQTVTISSQQVNDLTK